MPEPAIGEPTEPSKRAFRPARRRAGLALLALLALAVAAERARWFPSLMGSAEVARAWIWSADPPGLVEPRAFFLARDFELAEKPGSATLEVLGDPEYVAYLGDTRVGSGRPGADPEVDRYDVTSLLRAGANRIVLELRSATGSGAATARIVDGAGRELVSADGDWMYYGSYWHGLLEAEPLFPTGRAAVLGRSPFARWSDVAAGELRPRFDQASAGAPLPAVAVRDSPSDAWRPLPPEPPRRFHLGGRIEVDFGREVAGYLQLVFDRREATHALLGFRSEPATTSEWAPDVVVLAPANRFSWQDATPRRFRYVELVGLEEVSRIALLPVTDASYAALARGDGAERAPAGLLGARPFPVRLPVVDEIWRAFPPGTGAGAAERPGKKAGKELRRGGGARKKARARERVERRHPAER